MSHMHVALLISTGREAVLRFSRHDMALTDEEVWRYHGAAALDVDSGWGLLQVIYDPDHIHPGVIWQGKRLVGEHMP